MLKALLDHMLNMINKYLSRKKCVWTIKFKISLIWIIFKKEEKNQLIIKNRWIKVIKITYNNKENSMIKVLIKNHLNLLNKKMKLIQKNFQILNLMKNLKITFKNNISWILNDNSILKIYIISFFVKYLI